ncbi:MAG TPA: hypothetical protein VK582_17165 [Pyrinomonadaceae bacterium]|nr:hypothetical protein [Pyrinomonadaceae bacterium]
MKKLFLIPLLVFTFACGSSPGPGDSNSAPYMRAANDNSTTNAAAAIPYSVTLEGFSIAGFTGVHSAAVAGSPEKLIVLGGRRNGMHGFPPNREAAKGPAFPKTEANDTIYVLDLKNRKLLGSASVGSLPAKVANQFKANNLQSQLVNGWLYIMGGYGPDLKKGTLSTLSYVTVVNFDALTDAVVNKKPLDATFAAASIVQFDHPALAITGGDLELLPDTAGGTDFVLAFGHQYDGEYTPGGGLVNQTYNDGVRVFQFEYPANNTKPSKLNFLSAVPNPAGGQMDPENPYHRRDLTLKPSLDSSGKRRLVAYGGVFKGGRMEGFLNPVFVGASAKTVTLTPNTTTFQYLSQYNTAAIQLFDNRRGSGTIYTTFFGGISQYYWDEATKTLKHDALNLAQGIDGLPFINSVSTLKMPTSNDTGSQFLHVGQTMPPASAVPQCTAASGPVAAPFGGTETRFVIASGVTQATPGVLQLSAITSTSVVGYFVGGIASTVPYPNSATCVSSMFYQVTINPSQATNTVQLQTPPSQ